MANRDDNDALASSRVTCLIREICTAMRCWNTVFKREKYACAFHGLAQKPNGGTGEAKSGASGRDKALDACDVLAYRLNPYEQFFDSRDAIVVTRWHR
nr:hypothetical protein [uncultured Cohaesibacter sp.]